MRVVRFLCVGVFNTALSASVFLVLFEILPSHPTSTVVSQWLSYGAGTVVGFHLHRSVTYRCGSGKVKSEMAGEQPQAWMRFLALDLFLLVATALALALAIDGLGLLPAPSWLFVALAATATKFVVLDRVVFS